MSPESSDIHQLGRQGDQELDPGPATVPRPAATVILLRGGAERLEVLLVKRTPRARFMGGVWVFPGGAVEPDDERAALHGDGGPKSEPPAGVGAVSPASEGALRIAAIRELREETGISLPADAQLVKFAHWITPAQVRIRFDTHFFLAELPPGQEPVVDGLECVDQGWFTPKEALAARDAGEIVLVLPTVRNLLRLGSHASAAELLREDGGR